MKRLGRLEKKFVHKVLRSEFRSSKYTGMVPEAERGFSSLVGVKHSLACSNGTATLHLALEALGVGAGDEVIVPSLTMSATSLAVLHANATPIFADVVPSTWQINPVSVKAQITHRTKAIISVSLYGGCPDYEALLSVANGIPVIEDNAEAIGTLYRGRPIGTFGSFSSYSFQSSKHLTAGEGGMLCTDSDHYSADARVIQTLGYSAVRNPATRKIPKAIIQNPSYLRHESLGWNYRVSELTGAVMLGQIKSAGKLVRRRIETAKRLSEVVTSVDWAKPQQHHDGVSSSFWAFAFALDTARVNWEELYQSFVAHGGKGFYAAWALGYLEPAFQQAKFLGREAFLTRNPQEIYSRGQTPVAEELQPRIVALRTNEWTSVSMGQQLRALRRAFDEVGS